MVLYEEGDMGSTAVNAGFNRRVASDLDDMREAGVFKDLQHILGQQVPVLLETLLIAVSQFFVCRVQFTALTAVGHGVLSGPRQFGFQRVGAGDGSELGMLRQLEQMFPGMFPRCPIKITDQEQAAAGPGYASQVG